MLRRLTYCLAAGTLVLAGHALAHHVETARGRACYQATAGVVQPDIPAALACGWDPTTGKLLR